MAGTSESSGPVDSGRSHTRETSDWIIKIDSQKKKKKRFSTPSSDDQPHVMIKMRSLSMGGLEG